MRSVPEWHGATDDAKIPDRVKLRVFLKHDGCCSCCGRKIAPGEAWECDHVVALVNGGENRETNLRPLLAEHHAIKTQADLKAKSATYKTRKKHHGVRKKSRFACSRDSPWKKRMDGRVVRR